jgi:hypothetical protein
VAGGDVAHVHHVQRPVHVERDLAQEDTPDQAVRGPGRIIGTEDEGGIDDDDIEAVGGQAKGLELGLVLRVDVGDAQSSRGEGLVLIRGPARRCRPQRPGRGRVHHPLDARAERLLHDQPGAVHVDREDPLRAAGAHRRGAGDVEDPLGAIHRPAHCAAIGHVTGDALEVEVLEMIELRRPPRQQAQLVAAPGQRPGQVGADEAGAAG